MQKHNHHYHELKYCRECDVVYCHCGKEWIARTFTLVTDTVTGNTTSDIDYTITASNTVNNTACGSGVCERCDGRAV